MRNTISRKMKVKLLVLAIVVGMFTVLLATVSACGPQAGNTTGSGGGGDVGADVAVAWSIDTDCSICHSLEGDSISDSASLASTHASGDKPCLSCHVDDGALTDVHEGATASSRMPKYLDETTVPEEDCITCHDLAQLKDTTADSTLLKDSNQLVVNPHDVPDTPGHAKINCTSCHVMHQADYDVKTGAPELCFSCHHEHEFSCYTCHQ